MGRYFQAGGAKQAILLILMMSRTSLQPGRSIMIIGMGKPGLMKATGALKKELERLGIELVEQPTATAMQTFNRLYDEGKNVCAGFHLTC